MYRQLGAALAAVVALFAMAPAALAQSCTETTTHSAEQVAGEVAGAHMFSAAIGPGWTFMLRPVAHGWDLELHDQAGVDLSQLTPPLHSDVNPRQIYGWHFRNAANTGANEGDVNAPQLERRFGFAATPGEGPVPSGIGWLRITDYGLADLTPGTRARMVYLQFVACVLYPKSEDEQQQEAELASPIYLPEELEMIRSCGLGPEFQPEAWVMPRVLSGDFDGDDVHDFAMPISRVSDGRHGLALCRAGTWLDVFGPDSHLPGSDLAPAYLEQVEAWSIGPITDVPTYEGEEAVPPTRGDVLTIERIEKSAYSLFWTDEGFRSHRHFVFVEP